MSAPVRDSAEATCTDCGSSLPAAAGYCPGCGRPVSSQSGTTIRLEVPPSSGPSAVSFASSEPHWFGVPPAGLLLALTVVLPAVAAALFALGHWPYALIAVGLAALAAVLFMEVAGRRPDSAIARRSRRAIDGTRARAGSALEALAIRSRAQREAALLRLERRRLDAHRRDLLAALGDAVYRSADASVPHEQLTQLDARVAELDAELRALTASTHEGVARARLAGRPTELVSVPEPYPPPDEGTPPAPAQVPEPYPPPDEGTPPQPDPVPFPAEPSES